MKEFNNLYNEKQEYKKKKQIIEQELANNKTKIDLEYQNKLLKDRINDLKNKDSLLKDFEINSLSKSNNELNRLKNLKDEYEKINISNLSKLLNIERDTTELEKIDTNNIIKNIENSKFYEHELNLSDSTINYLDKIIKENLEMPNKKIDIIN